MKKISLLLFMTMITLAFIPGVRAADLGPIPEKLPVPGIINVIDLGATKCIPCKMMAPILSELKKEYEGQAVIVFLDVREHPPWAKQFGIKSIPTQIFFDNDGQEIFRHEGFFDKKSIVAKIEEIKAGQGRAQKPLTVDDLPIEGQATLVMIDDSLKDKRNFQKNLDLLHRAQLIFPSSVFVIFVDCIKYPKILSKFKVETTPSLIFFDSSGKEIHRADRILDLEQIVAVFQAAGVKPEVNLKPTVPAPDKPTLLCLGDEKVTSMEKILPLLDEFNKKYNNRLAVFYADREKHPEMAEKYKPEKYPAFILFDARGRECHRQYGGINPKEMDVQLEKIGLKP